MRKKVEIICIEEKESKKTDGKMKKNLNAAGKIKIDLKKLRNSEN